MQPSTLASAVTCANNSNPDIATDTGCAGKSRGYSVAVLPTIASFFSSLSPRFKLEDSQPMPPAQVACDEQMPGKKNWSDNAGDLAGKIRLACNLASSWVPQLQAVSETVATLCSSITLAKDLCAVLEPREGKKYTAASPSGAPGAACAGLFTLIALDRLTCAAAVPAPGERGSPQQPIDVPDSETLAKIGRNDSFPADSCYRQTNSFSYNHTEPGVVFQGDYQGGGHTISHLKSCLFSKLDRYATVRDLRLADVFIEDTTTRQSGALACEMASFSSARNIKAKNVTVFNRGEMGEPFEPVSVGVITGHQRRAAEVSDIELRQCTVLASNDHAAVGVVAGRASGELKNINITIGYAGSLSPGSPTGIGAGDLRGNIDNMLVNKSTAQTHGKNSPTGIGAGIVRDSGRVSHLAVFSGKTLALREGSPSGIGAGQADGKLRELTMFECRSGSNLPDAPAGIGAGLLNGEIEGMVSIGCNVSTLDPGAGAAIGAGRNRGWIRDLTVVDGTVWAQRSCGLASGISTGGRGTDFGTVSHNSRVQIGEAPIIELRHNAALSDLPVLCARGDARFVAPDCQIHAPIPSTPWKCPALDQQGTLNSRWQPIEINDIEKLSSIGFSDRYPIDAHYIQTEDLNGALLDRNTPLIFSGHYDGQNHTIDGLITCLFDELQGTVRNLQLTNATVIADGRPAGVLACKMSGAGGVENIQVNNSQVITWGEFAPGGMISGLQRSPFNQVRGSEIHRSTLQTHGFLSDAGMVSGVCLGDVDQVGVHHSELKTHGGASVAGLGCGLARGLFTHFTATCDQVEAHGNHSSVGGFAGLISDGRFGPATLVRTTVTGTGKRVSAGVGAGAVYGCGSKYGWLKNITALECRVRTLGREAKTGIGAGHIETHGSLHNINVIRSNLVTEGDQASAGICAGVSGNLTQISACNLRDSTLYTLGDNSRSSPVVVTSSDQLNPGELHNVTIINAQVNGRSYYIGSGNMTIDTAFCRTVDPRFVQPDCQARVTQTCPMVPLNITAVATTAPAVAVAGVSVGTLVGLVAGSALVVGAGILGTYLYHRPRQARETIVQDVNNDCLLSLIEDEVSAIPNSIN